MGFTLLLLNCSLLMIFKCSSYFIPPLSHRTHSSPCVREGEGVVQSVTKHHMGRGVGKNVTWQFLLVISLVKVNKICCHTRRGWGGSGNDTKCHIGGGGSKKCWKSVMYYLNAPLQLKSRYRADIVESSSIKKFKYLITQKCTQNICIEV
jgi:hypothetical protein